MRILIDLDRLKASPECGDLYYTVVTAVQALHGVHEVEIPKVDASEADRFRLSQWALTGQVKTSPAPAPAPQEPQISMAELEAEQRNDMAARARLAEYANLGLLDTEGNARQIKKWVIQNRNGIWNVENVDAAVLGLGDALQWKEHPPTPQSPEPVAEVLGTLPNGEKQLPLNADEYVMKRASVKQLLDLNQRRRKASNQMVVGKNHRGFGATF